MAGLIEKAIIEGEAVFQSSSIKPKARSLSMLEAFALAE